MNLNPEIVEKVKSMLTVEDAWEIIHRHKTEAGRAASRRNGALGGRPRGARISIDGGRTLRTVGHLTDAQVARALEVACIDAGDDARRALRTYLAGLGHDMILG